MFRLIFLFNNTISNRNSDNFKDIEFNNNKVTIISNLKSITT